MLELVYLVEYPLDPLGAAMEQGVTAGKVNLEARRIAEPPNPAFLECRQQQPKPRNRHRIRIQIHTMHTVDRPLHKHRRLRPRLASPPPINQPRKTPQQKVPAAAGRVNHLEPIVRAESPIREQPVLIPRLRQPKLLNRRVERAVQNEFLDKHRRLEQRVFLTSGLREILV